MTRENDFIYGTGTETVGYTVNGDSDDWMYGDEDEKMKIYALTPESGPGGFGFWPPQSEIPRLAYESLEMNLTTAELILDYSRLQIDQEEFVESLNFDLAFELERVGLRTSMVSVSIEPLDEWVTSAPDVKTVELNHLQVYRDAFSISLDPSIIPGTEFQIAVHKNNSFYQSTDTISLTYGQRQFEVLISDSLTTDDSWVLEMGEDSWGLTASDFVSAPTSMTDSPDGRYQSDANEILRLTQTLSIPETAISARVSFAGRWAIEPGYDYCLLEASNDGINWNALCGKYTRSGTGNQRENAPLWDGVQTEWVQEDISLDDYIGQEIELRFVFVSDGNVRDDGFYFDDFRVEVVEDIVSGTDFPRAELYEFVLSPNPVTEGFVITGTEAFDRVQLINSEGKKVLELDTGASKVILDKTYPSGIYTVLLYQENRLVGREALVIVQD